MTNVVTSPPPSHVASLGNPVSANNLAISTTHHTYVYEKKPPYVRKKAVYIYGSLVG